MADEISLNYNLVVNKDNLSWRNDTGSFTADMTNARGPVPGYISATTSGTTVDLSLLTTPAIGEITNLDSTNYVELGSYSGGTFYPVLEVGPGETFPFKLSRNIAALRLRANSAACGCVLNVFDA